MVVMGSGRLRAPEADGGAAEQAALRAGSDVTLDFVNVDVRDVPQYVLGDLLQVSFASIHPCRAP